MNAHELHRVTFVRNHERDCAARLAEVVEVFEKFDGTAGLRDGQTFPACGELEHGFDGRSTHDLKFRGDNQESGMSFAVGYCLVRLTKYTQQLRASLYCVKSGSNWSGRVPGNERNVVFRSCGLIENWF